jgi:hypothetical protein
VFQIRDTFKRIRILGSVLKVNTYTSVFKDSMSLKSHKRFKIKDFLKFLAC